MGLFRAIAMGLREIWGHKVRSILTLFCVLLGVTSVVVTVAYMKGLTASWRTYLNERGGLERLRVRDEAVPEAQEHLASLSPGRTIEDARAIKRLSKFVANVSPVIELGGSPLYRNGKRIRAWEVEAIEPSAQVIKRFDVERGRFITDIDNQHMLQVMVLGSEPLKGLFDPSEDPIGQTVVFEGLPFEVVGILHHEEIPGSTSRGGNWLRFKNDVVFIPLRTAQAKISNEVQVNDLDVQINDVAHLGAAVAEGENILLRMQRGVDYFLVETSESASQNIEKQERSLLTAGGAISLTTMIVGGIGIMNLMLASINERVREIGIRKSIGARPRDIFFQFCVESVTLCVLGGIAGVALGQGVIYFLRQVMTESEPPIYTVFGVVAGFSASVTIGVLAGIYPAFRASRLDPIEALRYE